MTMKFPMGTDNFRVLREENKYYVDKTLMIKDFLDDGLEGVLITRPRRFGKTLNMTMLREFFDMTRDSENLFTGLNIMNTEYANRLNSTPVVFLNFKNCDSSTQDGLLVKVCNEIGKEYARFQKYFGNKTNQEELIFIRFKSTLQMFENISKFQANDEKEKVKVNEEILESSLEVLIQVVHLLTGIKPIVLIDEYDQPIISAHESGFRKSFSKIYASFLTEGLKSNEHLAQALMTGIQRVAKESIFSKLNHFVPFTVLSERYSSYFGLTVDETAQALEYFGFELNEEVKGYYDGYRFGKTDIYNPWSIFNYLFEKELQSYWVNTSTNALIRESILHAESIFKREFEKLIVNGEVVVTVNLKAAFMELRNTATLWGLLVNAGYLTVVEKVTPKRLKLKVPNKEVMEEFRSIVAAYTRLSETRLDELFDALMDGDVDAFLDTYRDIVDKCTSYFDDKEQAYHSMFLGMAVSVWGLYKLKSNREAGDGRADIVMESFNPELRPHIIVEFKQGEDIETLKQDALNQIFEKRYHALFDGPTLCLGIAHNKKKCGIAHKLMD